MLRSVMLAGLIAAIPATVHAQAHPLAGTWSIEYPEGGRIEAGQASLMTRKGTLTVEARTDSLIGTLAPQPIEGQPARPAMRFAGARVDGTATLAQRSEGRMVRDGEESVRIMITTMMLEVSGDELSGSVGRQIEGMEVALHDPQSLKGVRVKPAH